MPSTDTTLLITGATDGLGRAVAERLAHDGARVLLHGRDPDRLDAAARDIAAATGNPQVSTHLADLADLDQVRRMAVEIVDTVPRLDALVNNAGIGSGLPDSRERQVSADGHELRFAVNHLAGFLLTHELLGLLRASAPARVVFVASLAQQAIDFDDVMLERGYHGGRAYAQSKLAQVMTAMELAERLPADEVTVNSLHPGTYMPTKIVLEERGNAVDTLETGVDAVVRLAAGADVAGVTGRFYDRQREARADPQAYDAEARRRLWDRSVRLTGVDPAA